MRASEAEFRFRFWIIFGLFWLGFACYYVDHENLSVALIRALAPRLDLDAPAGRHALQAVFGFAALLGVMAAALRSWASAYLRSEVVHDTALRTEALVADGPFRHVRNPLYLGNVLLSLGWALLMSRLGALVLVVGQTLFLLRLIGREESSLDVEGGDGYRAYRATVPRLVPSLLPRVPAGRTRAHWMEGIAGEAFGWILAAAQIAFALTLNSRILLYAVGVGFAVYWILFALWKKRARAERHAASAS